MAKLVVFDRRKINSVIMKAIQEINPTLRIGDRGGEYSSAYKPEDYLDRHGFSVIEAKPVDNRPRSGFFNLPDGKLSKPLWLATLDLEVDGDIHKMAYLVEMVSYGSAGRAFADQLSTKLLEAGLDVVLYVEHEKYIAKIF